MRKAFLELSKKEKVVLLILLVLGYISPAIGVLAFFFVGRKNENRRLRYTLWQVRFLPYLSILETICTYFGFEC